ncbi:ciliary microtubule-associated protein 2-like [Trichomycterus rosablanca]|uniref:ciliary microtubule-associated protein 2-like n=1 Tax=Trichomycterus rosablanca TaxID=2290929 RepID=UPI002F354247
MSAKKFKGAPFGTQSPRFCVSADLNAKKRIETYTYVCNCRRNTSLVRSSAPETYNPVSGDFGTQAVQEGMQDPGWRRVQDTVCLDKMPHLPYMDVWENKQFLKTKVGPGTYRIASFIEEMLKKPGSMRGICETREERFKDCQNIIPGPGTYGIPSAPQECKRRSLGTCCSSMQSFPDNTVQQDSGLGPGTYNLKSFTDVLLNRRVSKRGPYDLFTSSRNKPIAYGYFAAPKMVNLNPGEYTEELPKFDEELQRQEKRKQGVFSNLEQYPAIPTERIYISTLAQCPRPATFPSPGSYEVSPKKPVHEFSGAVAPFLSSAPRMSKRTEALLNKNHNPVGPGRYNLSSSSLNTSSNGHRSSFISGTERYPQCPARDKSLQERLKPINVPLEKRSFLLQPEGPFNDVRICSSA